MKLWPILLLSLLVMPLRLHGETASTPAQLEKKGNTALSSDLWEVAELHFREALRYLTLTPEVKARLTLRLAETLIRSGQVTNALDLLNQPATAKNLESSFWKAQALLAQNRYSDAAALFTEVLSEPASTYQVEAGLTLASIQLTLGQADQSLATLNQILPKADEVTRLKIQIYQVEILLDLGRTSEARALMPKPEKLRPESRTVGAFLEASLQLREGKFAEAQSAFQTLITQPQTPPLPPRQSAAAALGLAEAIHGQGNTAVAIDSLITFLQEQPDSALLEPIFSCIIRWLPEKPNANDPTLERISQWITPSLLPAYGLIASGFSETGATAALPTYAKASTTDDLLVFSIFTRAIGFHKIATPESRAEAKRLLRRILIEHPDHLLANHSLYHLARWALESGSYEQAFSMLDTLREMDSTTGLKGQATLLEAHAAYTKGDSKLAIQLFDEAAANLTGQLAASAKLQGAIARLRNLEINGSSIGLPANGENDPDLRADFELERALFTTPPAAKKTALEQFLTLHPEHPRTDEARIAAVEAALISPSPDLDFAKNLLDQLAASPAKSPALSPTRINMAKLQLAAQARDLPTTKALAESILSTYAGQPVASDAALILGRTLFQTRNYNDARLVLEKLAASDTDPVRAQAAWLLAASSAALGGTQQSKEAALILFDKAIQAKGDLSTVATLQKGEQLIDMKRFAEAAAFLESFTKSLEKNDPVHLPAGMLLAKALYAQGAANPASLVQALAVYDQLITHVEDQPVWHNRLQYLRGLTLEQLPDEKDPSKKREGKALQAYLSVLEITGQPLEWEYFEQCGFRALAILIKSERWQAAISVAKKIASFNGPHANDAALRASELELKYPNW